MVGSLHRRTKKRPASRPSPCILSPLHRSPFCRRFPFHHHRIPSAMKNHAHTPARFLGYPMALLLAVALLFGCDSTSPASNDDPADTTDTTTKNDTVVVDTLTANDTVEVVTYELTIINNWGEADYPANYPEAAHFSHLGGAVHNSNVSFWRPGDTVSDGMREMAETGNVIILANEEVQDAIDAGDAWKSIYERIYTPEQPSLPPGSRTTTVELHRDYPLITLVTMLGPSPDWFVGLSGYSLWKEDRWQEQVEIDLTLWDGGTRDGYIPMMGGPEIVPAEPIGMVTYDKDRGVYEKTTEAHVVGRMVFRRVDR